jgi:hypothetical protein
LDSGAAEPGGNAKEIWIQGIFFHRKIVEFIAQGTGLLTKP